VIQIFVKAAAGLGLWLAIAGCAAAQIFGRVSWKEEVLLHDGQKIVATRTVKLGGRHEVRQRPPIKEQTLSFRLPESGQKIVWTDTFAPDLGTASFLPMMLEVYRGGIYLVANPMGCLSYNKWGRPNPPYVVFQHQGGQWRRVDLAELPQELKTPNLVFSSPDEQPKRLGTSGISAEAIKNLYAGYDKREFRSILREPIVYARGERCWEAVSDGKGGWLGADWFRRAPNKTACVRVCEQNHMDAKACPCVNYFDGK
jgi:hypothetical protein